MDRDKELLLDIIEDLTKPVKEVFEIFKDFFGEERVDLQGVVGSSKLMERLAGIYYSTVHIGGRPVRDTEYDRVSYLYLSYEDKLLVQDDLRFHLREILDDPYILVHFPEVRITNENGNFVDIKDLWAKISVKYDGTSTGYFGLNRSHYPLSHYKSNYMHSHIDAIPTIYRSTFVPPCLGSGPIQGTIVTLSMSYNPSIWMLFCRELDVYVRVESLKGVPYHRLENLVKYTDTTIKDFTGKFAFNVLNYRYNNSTFIDIVKEFVNYLVEASVIPINYINGCYGLGMSFIDYMVTISNTFIQWHNMEYNKFKTYYTLSDLLDKKILFRCKVIGDHLSIRSINNRMSNLSDKDLDILNLTGTPMFIFKGNQITLTIEDDSHISLSEDNTSLMLNLDIAESIINSILKVMNYYYGNKEEAGTGVSSKRKIIL